MPTGPAPASPLPAAATRPVWLPRAGGDIAFARYPGDLGLMRLHAADPFGPADGVASIDEARQAVVDAHRGAVIFESPDDHRFFTVGVKEKVSWNVVDKDTGVDFGPWRAQTWRPRADHAVALVDDLGNDVARMSLRHFRY